MSAQGRATRAVTNPSVGYRGRLETVSVNARRPPEMSVVLVTPDGYEAIRETVRHLRAQTIRDRLEVIIVAPSADKLDPDISELQGFLRFHVIEVGTIRSTGAAIAAGVRQASAPIVGYAEEHSYPEPGWAAALIEAHRGSWACVGAVLSNANPRSAVSWASLFLDFGPWVEPQIAGEVDRLPWHHTTYKRALLLSYGQNLEAMLETEGILQSDLQAKGYRLYLEPAAKARHVNISLLSSLIRGEFHGGRLFGAARAQHGGWSTLRRVLYVGASPLIPLVHVRRILRDFRRAGRRRDLLLRLLPHLLTGVVAHAIGETIGYTFGAGPAAQQRCSFELNRHLHVTAGDKLAQRETTPQSD